MLELILLDREDLIAIRDREYDKLPWNMDSFSMSRYIEKTYGKRIHQVQRKKGFEGWFSFWAIVDGDHLCGLIGFKGYSPTFPEVEVHYAINPVDQKKGYGTEALKCILDWGFDKDPNIKIYARHVRHGNIGSRKVLERCGFVVYKRFETFSTYIIQKI